MSGTPTPKPLPPDAAPGPGDSGAAVSDPNELVAVPPPPISLLGRWFGVPFLIVGSIVGCAALVVVLFGGPASQPRRSVDALLDVLETGSGAKSMGILLPREKELWQAALELSQRLDGNKDPLAEPELREVAERLVRMIETDWAYVDRVPTTGPDSMTHLEVRSARLAFLVHALGRTGHAEAVAPLVRIVESGREPFVTAAITELGNLYELAASRKVIDTVVAALERKGPPERKLVACTALSVLADGDDLRVIDVLDTTRLTGDGDIEWSAALALGRLGSNRGKLTLLELMNRAYLEADGRFVTKGDSGETLRYKLQPGRVDQILIAAIDAAAHVDDADLAAAIGRLTSDPSAPVRSRAIETVSARN